MTEVARDTAKAVLRDEGRRDCTEYLGHDPPANSIKFSFILAENSDLTVTLGEGGRGRLREELGLRWDAWRLMGMDYKCGA